MKKVLHITDNYTVSDVYGSYHYLDDCKKMFPKHKWAHSIESWCLSDLPFFVKRYLDDLEGLEDE